MMKKIFTKKIALSFFGALLIISIAVIACKKMEDISNTSKNSNKLSQFYSSSLMESLKKETIALEFYQEMNKIPIKVHNGILSFKSIEDLNSMYELIITYSDQLDDIIDSNTDYSKYAESDQMPTNPISYLFESKLGFNSLRMDIEEKTLMFERGNGIPDDNDPDDHFTVSSYMRTLLSPDCEIIVDDLICVYYDKYAIGVMNYDWAILKELHKIQKQNNFDEIKANEFCSMNPEVFMLTDGTEPTLNVGYSFKVDPKNPETIQFINYSSSETYKEMKYFWDFGDGTTSTERNPKHTFMCKGQTVTCLTVEIPNGNASKAQNTDCVTINFPIIPNSNPQFTASENSTGTVSFTCTSHPNPSEIYSYKWNFGDNTAPQTVLHSNTVSHKYTLNGKYNVKLYVTFKDNGVDSTTKQISVINAESTSNCCDANDREVEKDKPYTYNNENYRIKQVVRITNVWPFHRMVSKTINQKQNGNNWNAAKADYINTGFSGTVFLINSENPCPGCGCSAAVNIWKHGWFSNEPKENKKRVEWDHGLGARFRVSKNSFASKHYIKHGDIERINGFGPSVSSCD